MKKVVVCYSGGHSSALVAIEAVRRYGKNNVILLNHDISSKVEHADIKRFKRDVADYLDVDITYANHPDYENMTPLEICRKQGTINGGRAGMAVCTYHLKTTPFYEWLDCNYPASFDKPNDDIVILYGFDKEERLRIQRRGSILGAKGYFTDFPLAYWDRTIEKTEDVGINRPSTYRVYKHANCFGCLKGGRQHWYCIYCLHPRIWEEAKRLESDIGYTIKEDISLEELEPKFHEMKHLKGICPSQKMQPQRFWAEVERRMPGEQNMFPCECAI